MPNFYYRNPETGDYHQLANLQGNSAYEVAVSNGFQGTEEEWLESLIKQCELPIADSTTLGGVKIGDNVTRNDEGKISVTSDNVVNALGYTPVDSTAVGVTVATLKDGKIPENQLPSFVDDVIEFDDFESFPLTGETGKIYVDKNLNETYRWSGSQYIKIAQSLSLSDTAGAASTIGGSAGISTDIARADHTHPFQSYTDLKNKPFNAISENGGLSVENNKLVLTDKQAYDEAVSRSIENQGTVGYSAKNLLDSAPEATVSSTYDDIGFTVNSDGSITIPPRAASVKPCMIKLERSPVPISEFPENIIMSLTGGKGLIKLNINYARGSNGIGVVGGEEVYNGDKVVNLSGVQDKYAIFYLYLNPDTPITEELTLHFMIRDARITDDTYVPYQGGSITNKLENITYRISNLELKPALTGHVGGITASSLLEAVMSIVSTNSKIKPGINMFSFELSGTSNDGVKFAVGHIDNTKSNVQLIITANYGYASIIYCNNGTWGERNLTNTNTNEA